MILPVLQAAAFSSLMAANTSMFAAQMALATMQSSRPIDRSATPAFHQRSTALKSSKPVDPYTLSVRVVPIISQADFDAVKSGDIVGGMEIF